MIPTDQYLPRHLVRDRVVVWVANQVLRLASPFYQQMLTGSIVYGMRAAARDAAEGRPDPPDWRDAKEETPHA